METSRSRVARENVSVTFLEVFIHLKIWTPGLRVEEKVRLKKQANRIFHLVH